ncbi:hypothetical protein WOLCODRAFT_122822 [Wolfiporia cocos MD-104 SS10]|uniref:BTB domain-containing protein n=1 Tax=Wolfiporia cocos (strain MD-104) TaxID=742152 RepID=A0A2H3JNZ0_WOLCO|nr:hypothetical protein WOLCODRAFT_122822 [Wolfiporia cocos MD-104 SS10]
MSTQARTPVGTPMDGARISGSAMMSVSTTFHPNAVVDQLPSDLILVSSDKVYFHVHCYRILGASENGFCSLLPPKAQVQRGGTQMITLAEPADVLNVVMHTIYNFSASQFMPSFEALEAALGALVKYGVPLKQCVVSGSPLFALLLSSAPTRPIDTFALAGSHELEDLAVAVSPHLLAYSLPSLTDELARRIGPVYLKRLFILHYGRNEALKGLLLHPPNPHMETPDCSDAQQRYLTRAWALASAHLVWDARPNLSVNLLQATLRPLEKDLTCELCKQSLKERIAQVVADWSAVKRTI